jgi:hypothetical protein
MPTNKNIYDDIRITDKPNLDSSIIAASAKAVKSAYDIAQKSVYDLDLTTIVDSKTEETTGIKIIFNKNDTTSDYTKLHLITQKIATDGTNTSPMVITAKVLNDKITSRLEATPVKQSSYLTADTKKNGWYSVNSETIAGIENKSWLISKFGNSSVGYIYTAICTTDPRIVLNSNDTKNWYSPYAYWHA